VVGIRGGKEGDEEALQLGEAETNLMQSILSKAAEAVSQVARSLIRALTGKLPECLKQAKYPLENSLTPMISEMADELKFPSKWDAAAGKCMEIVVKWVKQLATGVKDVDPSKC